MRREYTSKRRHIIITGTGRAGTTFLMELFTVLGLDTGFDRSQFPYDRECRAGLEIDLRDPDAPFIVKQPELCETLPDVLANGDVAIDHALIPMRDLFSAAESRRANVRAARRADPGATPSRVLGGTVGTDDPEEQEEVLARRFHTLIGTIARHGIPTTFLSYPDFLADPEALFKKLPPPLRGPSKAAFLAAHKEVYRPDLVHDYGTEPAASQSERPDPPPTSSTRSASPGFAAGHFYSPLLDLSSIQAGDRTLPFDGPECWEQIDFRLRAQRACYKQLFRDFPPYPFPRERSPAFRYHYANEWYPLADALLLSGIIRKERPKRIIEVGSGYSSAVILDTIEREGRPVSLTCIDPFPNRLETVTSPSDRDACRIIPQRVQEVPLERFDELGPRDILFIDSSHVAKIGSDVAFLFLRVLPRLKPGVLIHFHDIFYPCSYPMDWIRKGWAWNESLFLRAFLIGNPAFRIVAFNAYANAHFPKLLRELAPGFLNHPGGSLWLRKVK